MFNVKYLENVERYDGGLKRGEIGNHQWAFNWLHDLRPWMTLNCPSLRSLKLHVKYFENVDRYDDGISGSQIGNHQCNGLSIDTMTFDLG